MRLCISRKIDNTHTQKKKKKKKSEKFGKNKYCPTIMVEQLNSKIWF